ncbi:MAG: LytTR family DNA-binding domain-containing protein [Spirosomataceae bacterium]
MKTKCLLVDDEPLATELIASYIEKIPDFEVVGVCHNAFDAFAFLQKNTVDLLFLDVQMPRMTGFELLNTLPSRPHVVMTTAFREYGAESYDFDVLDFLVKPIVFDRFMKAIAKFYQRRVMKLDSLASPDAYEQAYMFFKVDRVQKKIYLKDIHFIESLKDYVKIFTDAGMFVTYQRISYLEEKLPEDKFLRVHKSFIVSTSHINAMTGNFIKIQNKLIPIGRNYKNNVGKLLEV